MQFNTKRIGLGVALAALLMVLLARFADLNWTDFAAISPGYVMAAIAACMLTVALRALNYRVIAAQPKPKPLRAWIDLSLRHQFLFTAVPSGLGDIGFPVLAKRYVGTDIAQGAAIIGMARLRDLFLLPALGAVGLVATQIAPPAFLLLAAALGAGGVFAEQMAAPLGRLLRRLNISKAPPNSGKIALKTQLIRTGCTLASWLTAGLALYCAYRAAGFTMAAPQVFVMLAGLNLIGVLAISVGGLGVAEAGSTGVLILLGLPAQEAAQLSLVARPVLLLSILSACILWWGLRQMLSQNPLARTAERS